MACNINWLNKFYITPIKNIHSMKDFIYSFAKVLATSSSKNYERREIDDDEECSIW